jgi:hypothetical protein
MLYFIVAGREAVAVKIGFTDETSPDARLMALQTGNHEPLSLLAFGPGTMKDEYNLHAFLRADWIRGEWYKPTAQVLAAAVRLGLSKEAYFIDEGIVNDSFMRLGEDPRLAFDVARKTKWARLHPEDWEEFCSDEDYGRRRHTKEYRDKIIELVNEQLSNL